MFHCTKDQQEGKIHKSQKTLGSRGKWENVAAVLEGAASESTPRSPSHPTRRRRLRRRRRPNATKIDLTRDAAGEAAERVKLLAGMYRVTHQVGKNLPLTLI